MEKEHFRKLERMYLSANINRQLFKSTTIMIEHERAEIGLTITEKYFHAMGAVHGSVYFKLLDDAAFFAVSSVVHDVFVLTTGFNLHLIRPVSEGVIRSIGKLRYHSKNLFSAESTLYNEKDKEIAFGTGSFVPGKITLNEEIGYK